MKTTDYKLIKDVISYQRLLDLKWRGKCASSEYPISKEDMLGYLKPCCIFSFYGALLTSITRNSDKGYAKHIWKAFIETLRSEWDCSKEVLLYFLVFYCNRIELEKIEGYSSFIYQLLLFLKLSSYLTNKLNYFIKECVEETKEKESNNNEEEEFFDAQESTTEEAYKFYSSSERIVSTTLHTKPD